MIFFNIVIGTINLSYFMYHFTYVWGEEETVESVVLPILTYASVFWKLTNEEYEGLRRVVRSMQ